MNYYPFSTSGMNNNQKLHKEVQMLRRFSISAIEGIWIKLKCSNQDNKLMGQNSTRRAEGKYMRSYDISS